MRSVIISTLAAALLLIVPIASAEDIHVPADYPTIQQAIDAAQAGDEIIVAPDTYFENINLLGKAITLRSSDGPEVTIIDGANGVNVITLDSGEGPDTIIDGFTIRNAHNPGGNWQNMPIGMRNIGSSPTVRNCHFTSPNGGDDVGWGMYNEGGSPTVIDCTFTMGFQYDSFGGGMYNKDASVTIAGSTFSGNVSYGGGAAILSVDSDVTLTGSTVENNGMHVGDGVISHSGGTLHVSDSSFTSNWEMTSGDGGVAIARGWNSPPTTITIVNCTFEGNSGGHSAVSGAQSIVGSTFSGNSAMGAGAVQIQDGVIEDSVFVGNSGEYAGAVAVAGNVTILNSAFIENVSYVVASVSIASSASLAIGGSQFCGNNLHVSGNWTNLGGNSFGEFCPIGDLNGDGVVDVSDLLILLAAWGQCPRSADCPADINGDGVVDVSDLLILLANWG